MVDAKDLKEMRKAILEGDEKKVNSLLKRNADLASDWRPIMSAASLGRVEISTALINHYADVDAKSSVGDYRPLHRTIQPEGGQTAGPDHKGVLELLLKNGADIESRGTPYLITPLALAGIAGSKEFVKLLISKGARVTFFSASAIGDLKKIKDFVKDEPELINTRDVNGWTALHYCAGSRMGEKDAKAAKDLKAIAELLIEKGEDPKALADTMGRLLSPLRLALFNKSVAEVLLAKGADPNVRDHEQQTVLHAAAGRGQCAEVVKLLLKHKADTKAVDDRERTAYDIAESKKHADIMKALDPTGKRRKEEPKPEDAEAEAE